jgi:hypothetical protein
MRESAFSLWRSRRRPRMSWWRSQCELIEVASCRRERALDHHVRWGQARDLMAGCRGDAGVPVSAPMTQPPASCTRSRSKAPAVDCSPAGQVPAFTPVVVATSGASPAPPSPPSPPSPPPGPPTSGRIEIAIGDAVVRVIGQVEAAHLTTVLRAVRRAS